MSENEHNLNEEEIKDIKDIKIPPVNQEETSGYTSINNEEPAPTPKHNIDNETPAMVTDTVKEDKQDIPNDVIFKTISPFTEKTTDDEFLEIPSTHENIYANYVIKQNQLNEDNPDRFASDGFDTDELTTIVLNTTNGKNVEPGEVTNPGDTSDYVNEIRVDDGSLVNRQPRIKNIKQNGNINRDMFNLALTQAAGVGIPVNIPLWNSGFWISIHPPKNSELVNLYALISKEEMEVGRDTLTFVYSNQNVLNTKIITELIERHIKSSTLVIPEGDNIMEYIKYSDYQPMIAKLLESIYPDGHQIAQTCVNSYVIGHKGKPKCSFAKKIFINFNKLTQYDPKKITNKMITFMSNVAPNSVTVDEIKQYQQDLANPMESFELKSVSGHTFKFYFKSPSIYEMVTEGVAWVEKIKLLLSEMGEVVGSAKEAKIDELYNMSIMNIYKGFISKISFDINGIDNETTDPELIEDAFNTLSGNTELAMEFLNKVKEFIRKDSISIVGIPSFTCPSCNEEQTGEKTGKYHFEDIITLNLPAIFFALCILRIRNIKERITG